MLSPKHCLVPLLLLTSCARFSPVTIARQFGTIGWFHLEGAKTWRPVDKKAECTWLTSRVPAGDVIVLVPGVKGDGAELDAMLPALQKIEPAAVFMYRWVPWDDRDSISGGFAGGFSHLLHCLPLNDGRVIVVAHSAGGIVVSTAATLVNVPKRERTGPAAYLMTVASPLAGMEDRARNEDGRAEARFMLDFGTRIMSYPIAPTAIAAVHLRTHYPADTVMKPTRLHERNDPKIGIPGARQIDLPDTLTHDGSLIYVAEKIGDGTWRDWFPGK